MCVCRMQMSMGMYKPMCAHEAAIGCQVSPNPAHLISMRQDISVRSVAHHVWLSWLPYERQGSACLSLSYGCTWPCLAFYTGPRGPNQDLQACTASAVTQ